jgi:hypothetical protein
MLLIRPINEAWDQESSVPQTWRANCFTCTLRSMIIAFSAVAIAAAWLLLLMGIEPVPTWFYVFAWYPTLALLDAVASRLSGEPSVLWHKSALSLFIWSPVIWLLFEAANFRLMNWYYVSLPQTWPVRWAGMLLSFATVVPALLLAERVLCAVGVFRSAGTHPVRVRQRDRKASIGLGFATGMLALTLPRLFFPLIWGAAFLITDPLVYQLDRRFSLIGDVERGDWGRIGRLLLAGLTIGVLWETYNYWAHGKWIYTVPWLEQVKMFEMPPFGFVGFPVFALEAWSLYHLLCTLGVAIPLGNQTVLSLRRVAYAGLIASMISCSVLLGMEHFTISSTVPQLVEVPGVDRLTATRLRDAGIADVFDLAAAEPAMLHQIGLTQPDAATVISHARLVTLRGIGTGHTRTLLTIGVDEICELASQEPDRLIRSMQSAGNSIRPTPAEVRVWIRAARRQCSP